MSWISAIWQRCLGDLAVRLGPVLEERIARKIAERMIPEVEQTVMSNIIRRLEIEKPWKRNIFIPSMDVYRSKTSDPFMEFSTCSSKDFFHPEFRRISDLIESDVVFHRKFWEWVFVVHHAFRKCVIGPGKRGVVFAVGQEMLPAAFAACGMTIRATDAPPGVGEEWKQGNQFASGVAALPSGKMNRAKFLEHVTFSTCDMNSIDPSLQNFDLCWSSCALEHLGSLRRGLDFVLNSLNTLKVGGVAIHTTEFNLSSNDKTVESGNLVFYRRRDIEAFIEELRGLGHEVDDFRVAPDSLVIDGYVDTAPYTAPPHLKLDLGGYACTSAGLIIRRGK